jgi:dTDP-4-dehydrorhamnose 3,5-epimerase
MIFEETKLPGVFLIKPERKEDDRGFFSRSFCCREFAQHGLNTNIVQCSTSYNKKKGTFRGMHFQMAPFEEDKMVTCMYGAILDFIVDMRPESPTFKNKLEVELSSENGYILYIPKSFAHGFFTLCDHTRLFYQMTQFYQPLYARGFRFDDPAIDIQLPFELKVIADKDRNLPDLDTSINYKELSNECCLH